MLRAELEAAPVVVCTLPSDAVRALLSTRVAGAAAGRSEAALADRTGSFTDFSLSYATAT